jgi:hypothetical protein
MASLIRNNLIFVWLTLATIPAVLLGIGQASAERKLASFDEINVQRINIIEADGKPRVIISNRPRMAKAYWNGKEYQHQSHGGGGFLFFNDDGTEAGGMGFSNGQDGDKYYAGANMNFDQYQQDNTLQLTYEDRNGQRIAGMRVKDRPDESIFPALELTDKLARAKTDDERKQLTAQLEKLTEKYTGGGVRLFAGKQLDDSIVQLSDKQGHARLVLKVDGKGEASVEFLDASGKVTSRIAGKNSAK